MKPMVGTLVFTNDRKTFGGIRPKYNDEIVSPFTIISEIL